MKKILRIIFLLIIIIFASIIFKGYKMYDNAISEIDLETKILKLKANEDYVVFDYLPQYYVSAVVDIEDHRFYRHSGVDLISLGRAIVNNIKAKKIVEGGSSITQQLAKNLYFTQEQKFERKIAELFLVYNLEKNYTKNEIFELYVNTCYFGDGYYGVGEASKGYFNKNAKDMNLYESTLLAGIPNAPSIYAPTKNPDLANQRQKQVIRKMLKQGDLTEVEANELYDNID